MKQRMYNVFFSKTKSKFIAKALSECSYVLLVAYYAIARFFLKKTVVINKDSISEAEKKLNKPNINIKKEIDNEPINKNIDLSIVIPSYNAEKYLRECLDSVVSQKTQYVYEVIIVNDGSTDSTGEILKEYNLPFVKVIEQENKGFSGARNAGISCATGRYIAFVDSDDVLEPGSIERMVDEAKNYDADIVVGGYYMFEDDSDKKQFHKCSYEVIEKEKAKMIFQAGYPWGKIFKREIFNKVRFPEGMWFEDTMMCSVVYRMCTKMVTVDHVVYGYRQNPSGITKTARTKEKVLDHIWVMEDAIEQAHNNGIKDDKYLYGLCVGHYSSLLYRRISLMPEGTIKNAFIVTCGIIRNLDNSGFEPKNFIEKDIVKSFYNGNYKLWKLASFIV